MTDRIAELRALHDRTTKAWWKRGRSSHELTTQNDYHVAEFRHGNDALFCNEAHKSMDALLDCAETLAVVTAALEWQAHGRCRTGYYDGPIPPAAEAVERGVAALAKLEGRE